MSDPPGEEVEGCVMNSSTEAYAKQPIAETLAELQVDGERGLTQEEAQQRIKVHGYNEIPEKAESGRIIQRHGAGMRTEGENSSGANGRHTSPPRKA